LLTAAGQIPRAADRDHRDSPWGLDRRPSNRSVSRVAYRRSLGSPLTERLVERFHWRVSGYRAGMALPDDERPQPNDDVDENDGLSAEQIAEGIGDFLDAKDGGSPPYDADIPAPG
jgi:hypothetical protein